LSIVESDAKDTLISQQRGRYIGTVVLRIYYIGKVHGIIEQTIQC
jgi:hypothetical protein